MGPNALVTIRGRISGEPRTQALAVIHAADRRFVIGTFGDTNWCRNMRANPDVELRFGGRVELVTANELSIDDATNFFRETLPASVASMDVFGKLASRFLLWYAAPDIKSDPAGAATRRPVFELVSRP
jgi:deazaflavin-dependent oxidoreductase (nitroreductase family)